MLARLVGMVVVAAAMAVPAAVRGIEIQFDYRYDSFGLFDDPAARVALEAAGDTFDVLLDTLAPISPSGINTWEALFFSPATGEPIRINNFSVPGDALTVFVGARDLPGDRLGVGGPGGYDGFGTPAWLNTLASRGQGGQVAVTGPLAFEVGPWGGSLTFDTLNEEGQTRNWFFDLANEPAQNTTDFFSVAVHELGHLVGFGTAPSFQADVVNGFHAGAQVMSLNNGQPVRLHTDLAHWALGTRSPPGDPGAPIAAMDPTLTSVNGFSKRRPFTALDFAALDDMGWMVDPSVYVTPPAPIDGDYNKNGAVEQADLDLVLLNWGKPASAVPPTWTNQLPTGQVDQNELDGVLLNWGNMAALSAGPRASALGSGGVPEPETWLLLLIAGSACTFGRAAISLGRCRREASA